MYVTSVTLENLRGFKKLHFDFERPEGGYAGWTVFVGGNASGKSTLLKGIALALMGPDAGRELIGSSPLGWISDSLNKANSKLKVVWDQAHDGFKPGGKPPGPFDADVRWQREKGESNVTFRAAPLPKNKRTDSVQRGPWNPNASGWFFAGYGPMRRLSGSSTESARFSAGGGVVSRFVTLFREDAALSESEEWLKKNYARWLENDKDNLKELLDGVKALLNDDLLPHGMKITGITVDNVYIQGPLSTELPMRDISDGCRSIYATILDLVHGMFEVYGIDGLFKSLEVGHVIVDRPGVVLIDEIESHLHPEWQREIGFWLKRHFPNVQFLVSSHSPLICQAADENGLFVLPEPGSEDTSRPLTSEEYKIVISSRPDTILLTSAFGLQNTRSPRAVEGRAELAKLQAKKRAGGNLTSVELKRWEQLQLFATSEEEL